MFAFVGSVLCCIPFPWHIAAWNTGTCLYMAWTGLSCLVFFINSIIWNNNIVNRAPVWCDISVRFYVGIGFATPATCLCISRRLCLIAGVRNVVVTKAEKRRAVLIDLAIGVGIPVLGMILQYIPQGHRFDILEDVGCYPFTYNTPVAIAIVSVPPILIGCISAVYSVMAILSFNKSRKRSNELLSGQVTNNRYIRLMCLAGFGSFWTIVLGVYLIIRNCTTVPINPWKGWADTHFDFSRVDQIPAAFWRDSMPGVEASVELSRWLNIVNAFTFFVFFGFAEEARNNYSGAVQSLAKRVGVTYTGSLGSSFFNPSGSKSAMVSAGGGSTLPVFIQNHTVRKVDDLDSISDMSVSIRDVGGALSDENEKHFSPDVSYGAMSLADVGGALADLKLDLYPPSPSSGASSTSVISPPALSPTALPHISLSRPDSIEISPVRYLDGNERPISTIVSEPGLDLVPAPRRASDTPLGGSS